MSGTGDWFAFDDFILASPAGDVPEPGVLALLAIGLCGLGATGFGVKAKARRQVV
jgi:hypothetical protein